MLGPRGPVVCWDRRTVTPGRHSHILSLAFTGPRIDVSQYNVPRFPPSFVTGFSLGTRPDLHLPAVADR
jgi:hypothetical protein